MIDVALRGIRWLFPKEYESIMIFGSPRGGTTWLAEYLVETLKGIYIHEPLGLYNPQVSSICYQRFMPLVHQKEPSKLLDYIKEIDGGKLHSGVVKKASLPHVLNRNLLVIKFIKGVSICYDVAENFQHRKIILLTRSPISTIESQLNYGGVEQFYCQELFDNPTITSIDFNGKTITLTNEVDKLAFTYGLSYYSLKGKTIPKNVLVVDYESLLSDPERQLMKLSTFLGETIPYQEHLLNRKSSSFRQKVAKRKLNDNELSSISNIFEEMGVRPYSAKTINKDFFCE